MLNLKEKLKTITKRQSGKLRDGSSPTRQFASNLSFRSIDNLLIKLVSFILVLWFTRVLTSDELGLYSFALSVTTVFVIFGSLGIRGALTKVVPEKLARNKKKEAANWVLGGLKLTTLSALFTSLLLFIFSDQVALYVFAKPFASDAIKLAAGMIFFNVVSPFFTNLFVALKKNNLCVYLRIVSELSRLFFIVLLVSLGLSYIGALYGYMIGLFIFLALACLVLVRKYPLLFQGSPTGSREIFSYSKWFLAFGFTYMLLFSVDSLMISALMPIRFTGYYNIVLAVINAFLLLIPVTKVSLPFLSEVSHSRSLLEKRFKKMLYITLALTLSLAFFIVLLSKQMLTFFYPPEYVENGWLPLAFLAFMIPAKSLLWLHIQKLIVLGKMEYQLYLMLLAGALNFVLNYLLISSFGIVGAAIASVTSLLVVTLLTMYLIKRITKRN